MKLKNICLQLECFFFSLVLFSILVVWIHKQKILSKCVYSQLLLMNGSEYRTHRYSSSRLRMFFFGVFFLFAIIGMFITTEWTLLYLSYRSRLHGRFPWYSCKPYSTLNIDSMLLLGMKRESRAIAFVLIRWQISFDWMNIMCACETKQFFDSN